MTKTSSKHWHGCPIRFALGILGDKWTLLVVRDLMFKGKRHFGEFTDPEESIASNVLADRLKRLVDNGLAERERDPENRTRYIYRLTDKGMDLIPVMFGLIEWSAKHDRNTEVPADFLAELRRDPAGLAARVRQGMVVPAPAMQSP